MEKSSFTDNLGSCMGLNIGPAPINFAGFMRNQVVKFSPLLILLLQSVRCGSPMGPTPGDIGSRSHSFDNAGVLRVPWDVGPTGPISESHPVQGSTRRICIIGKFMFNNYW